MKSFLCMSVTSKFLASLTCTSPELEITDNLLKCVEAAGFVILDHTIELVTEENMVEKVRTRTVNLISVKCFNKHQVNR